MKRFLDVVLGGVLLLVSAPLLAVTALAVKVRMGSPVLFRQTRPGRHAVPFVLLKFRTMRPPTPSCQSDAERLTPLGRWLRRTSIDELPALVNVLRGEMSLVGPRPLLIRYLPYYRDAERIRHRVRPGLTGWAQVHGRNELGWDARLAHDVWYVRHRSLGLDAKILLKTLRNVLLRRGVVAAPGAAHPDLDEERREALSGPRSDRRQCAHSAGKPRAAIGHNTT